ncbi:MAG: hypothetical protein ACIARR_09005, partial [Phycisphaerales bacterium JB059]
GGRDAVMRTLPTDERALGLLADVVTGEAGESARVELDRLLGEDASALSEEFELGGGAADLAMMGPLAPMPASVRTGVDEAAEAFLAGEVGMTMEDAGRTRPGGASAGSARGVPLAFALGGWLAAAACLAIAGVLWVTTARAPVVTEGNNRLSVEQRRQALLESGSAVVKADWIGVGDLPVEGLEDHELDGGVRGEVVWSDDSDEGYMRIGGITPNDPAAFQYQLWIFDAERPVGELPGFAIDGLPELLTQRPVDGGVFDVRGAEEVIVPIDAKLPVGRGTIFAVTKERPGGVVVSDREIVFLAIRG